MVKIGTMQDYLSEAYSTVTGCTDTARKLHVAVLLIVASTPEHFAT